MNNCGLTPVFVSDEYFLDGTDRLFVSEKVNMVGFCVSIVLLDSITEE